MSSHTKQCCLGHWFPSRTKDDCKIFHELLCVQFTQNHAWIKDHLYIHVGEGYSLAHTSEPDWDWCAQSLGGCLRTQYFTFG